MALSVDNLLVMGIQWLGVGVTVDAQRAKRCMVYGVLREYY